MKLQIAMEKNDASDAAGHMACLRSHHTGGIGARQWAWLKQGDLEAAAALLIERLNLPDWRSEALVNMQPYKLARRTPTMKAMDERRADVTSRADVQGALAKVGRVEHVAVIAPQY